MGSRELPKDLLRCQRQFQAWRSQREVGSRIPKALWALAGRLAKKHGVSCTASALGLDYYTLKDRSAADRHASEANGAAFVELSSPLPISKQCLFELDDGTGATMRVQLVGYDAAEVAAVTRSFWNPD